MATSITARRSIPGKPHFDRKVVDNGGGVERHTTRLTNIASTCNECFWSSTCMLPHVPSFETIAVYFQPGLAASAMYVFRTQENQVSLMIHIAQSC